MERDKQCCNGRVAAAPWLQSVGGPSSSSLEHLSSISSLRLDIENPWWPWRNMERFQIAAGHRRLGITEFAQESALQKFHVPLGDTDDSTAEVELGLSQLACGQPHNLFVMLSLRKLAVRASSSFGFRGDIGHGLRGQQGRRDPCADGSTGSPSVLWCKLG